MTAGSSPVPRSAFVRDVTVCVRVDMRVYLRHGHAAGSRSRTYIAWRGMKQRCSNPNLKDWPRYGGRGIKVCERWQRFENFLADMGECPEGLWLDRVDSNGNYEPGNVRWATFAEQVHNQRRAAGELHHSAKLTVDEVIAIRRLGCWMTHRQLGRTFGVSHTDIGDIIRRDTWKQLVRKPSAAQQIGRERQGREIGGGGV